MKPQGTVVVTQADADGGSIKGFAESTQAALDNGTRIDLSQVRTCTSACTFHLAADACTAPETVFYFHGPQNSLAAFAVATITIVPPPVSFMEKAEADVIRHAMADLYAMRHPALGEWFLENAANKAGILTTGLTGQQLHDSFGVPFCN